MENFGIYINNRELNNVNHLCTCGNTWVTDQKTLHCDSCGTNTFKFISEAYSGGAVTSNYYLKLIDKGDWGFIVQKCKINAKYDKRNNTLTKTNEAGSTMYYDFRNNKFEIKPIRGDSKPITINNIPQFFREIDENNFLRVVSTDKTVDLFKMAKQTYGHGMSWSRPSKLSFGLAKLYRMPYYQILANAGFTYNFLYSFSRIINSIDGYTSRREESLAKYINKEATKPNEIINVPKYMLNYIKNLSLESSGLLNIRKIDEKFGADNVKNILDRFIDEHGNTAITTFLNSYCTQFLDVVDNYNYEPKRLAEYICREVKLQQGIVSPSDALTLLRDYHRMLKMMQLDSEKYSKSLKKDHDIATMNYRINEDKYAKQAFQNIVNQKTYQDLLFKDDKYIIVIPKEPGDLVAEGKNLSHCVASYVNDVTKEKCKIIFVRTIDKPDESLLTVEIRNEKIIQIKGFANRYAEDEERKFIYKWATKNKLSSVA